MLIPVLFSIIGFLSGGILFSYHIPKMLKKVDVVALSPDHNPGTANAMKLCDVPVGLTCLACDLLKGYLPVWGALHWMRIEDPALALVMLAPCWDMRWRYFILLRAARPLRCPLACCLASCLIAWRCLR